MKYLKVITHTRSYFKNNFYIKHYTKTTLIGIFFFSLVIPYVISVLHIQFKHFLFMSINFKSYIFPTHAVKFRNIRELNQ